MQASTCHRGCWQRSTQAVESVWKLQIVVLEDRLHFLCCRHVLILPCVRACACVCCCLPPSQLVLHHYVLKSKAEFVSKTARGSGAGNRKGWPYWQYVEQLANETCTQGLPVSKAFMASSPQLAVPPAGRVLHGCHERAVAAYEALLQLPDASAEQGGGAQQHTAAGHVQQHVAGAPGTTSSSSSSLEGLLPC